MGKTLPHASFPRTSSGASFARRLIADALHGWMSEEERLDFVLAVGEALSNAVRHGGGDSFAIRCSCSDNQIVVDVIDEGSGFERRPIEPPLDGENGGFGMLIIHKLTDEFCLLEGGRHVQLVKRPAIAPAVSDQAG